MIKLICGRSRAGKTTYSRQFDEVIHLDSCGSATGCYDEVLKRVAAKRDDVVIDGVYNTVDRRKALLDAYHGDGDKICIWLDTSFDVIMSRAAVYLPRVFDPPTLDEGWDEIVVIKGDDDVQSYSRQTENRPTC